MCFVGLELLLSSLPTAWPIISAHSFEQGQLNPDTQRSEDSSRKIVRMEEETPAPSATAAVLPMSTETSTTDASSPAGSSGCTTPIRKLLGESKPAKVVVSAAKQNLVWTRGRLIGCGGFAKVYVGLDSNSGKLIAGKEFSFTDENTAEAKAKILRNEISVMKSLQHPNIVRYLGADRHKTDFYIFMEYVAGGSIAGMLKEFGPLNEELTLNFTRQVVCGLSYLHDNGIIHRDIKGANVLVTVDGVAKLADFGSAQLITEVSGQLGTPYWMAPEVVRNEPSQGSAVDIWAVGCLVLELMTGKFPFYHVGDDSFAVLSYVASLSPHSTIVLPEGNWSNECGTFLRYCLNPDPLCRPSTSQLMDHAWLCGGFDSRSYGFTIGMTTDGSLRSGESTAFVSSASVATGVNPPPLLTPHPPGTDTTNLSPSFDPQQLMVGSIAGSSAPRSSRGTTSTASSRSSMSDRQVRGLLQIVATAVDPEGESPAVQAVVKSFNGVELVEDQLLEAIRVSMASQTPGAAISGSSGSGEASLVVVVTGTNADSSEGSGSGAVRSGSSAPQQGGAAATFVQEPEPRAETSVFSRDSSVTGQVSGAAVESSARSFPVGSATRNEEESVVVSDRAISASPAARNEEQELTQPSQGEDVGPLPPPKVETQSRAPQLNPLAVSVGGNTTAPSDGTATPQECHSPRNRTCPCVAS